MRVIDHERLRIALATNGDLEPHRNQIEELLVAWQSLPELRKEIQRKDDRIEALQEAVDDARTCLDDVPAKDRPDAYEDAREAVERARDALKV